MNQAQSTYTVSLQESSTNKLSNINDLKRF